MDFPHLRLPPMAASQIEVPRRPGGFRFLANQNEKTLPAHTQIVHKLGASFYSGSINDFKASRRASPGGGGFAPARIHA